MLTDLFIDKASCRRQRCRLTSFTYVPIGTVFTTWRDVANTGWGSHGGLLLRCSTVWQLRKGPLIDMLSWLFCLRFAMTDRDHPMGRRGSPTCRTLAFSSHTILHACKSCQRRAVLTVNEMLLLQCSHDHRAVNRVLLVDAVRKCFYRHNICHKS